MCLTILNRRSRPHGVQPRISLRFTPRSLRQGTTGFLGNHLLLPLICMATAGGSPESPPFQPQRTRGLPGIAVTLSVPTIALGSDLLSYELVALVTTAQWGKLRSSKRKWLVVTPFPGLRSNLAHFKRDPFSIF